jgi:glycosyltransferase involved in cell wall biosynthesis
MIVHILSVRKKVWLFRALALGPFVDRMLVYASAQRDFIVGRLRYSPERVVLTTFMVDTDFFSPDAAPPDDGDERVISAAGLEFRDYPTMIEAVRGIDHPCVIAAGSRWSKRSDSSSGVTLPANVAVCSLGYEELRQLYSRSAVVVVPLFETDFQAGITTILEAMAMGKAVICTRTAGQTDTIQDGDTGVYVRPGDVSAMRSAIVALLDDPARAAEIGGRAREHVIATASIEAYAGRVAAILRDEAG